MFMCKSLISAQSREKPSSDNTLTVFLMESVIQLLKMCICKAVVCPIKGQRPRVGQPVQLALPAIPGRDGA